MGEYERTCDDYPIHASVGLEFFKPRHLQWRVEASDSSYLTYSYALDVLESQFYPEIYVSDLLDYSQRHFVDGENSSALLTLEAAVVLAGYEPNVEVVLQGFAD